MQTINVSDLRKIDLNLALVFCVIYEAQSVTGAAQRLYLTQPAVSASLSKLRDLVGDELFVRHGRKLKPTPFADELAARLSGGLAQLQSGFLEHNKFDPKTATRVFRLGLLDDLEIGVLPALAAQLRTKAPGIRLSSRMTDFRSIAAQLEHDAIDVAVGVFDDVPKIAYRKELLSTSYRCLFDPKKLKLGRTLSLERYLELDHILVSFSGDFRGLFEEKFAKKGLKRNIVVNTPRFASVPYVLKQAPIVSTLPDYLAYRFAKAFGLATVAAPYEVKSFPIEMVWPIRFDAEPDHLWFRGLLANLLRMNTLVGV